MLCMKLSNPSYYTVTVDNIAPLRVADAPDVMEETVGDVGVSWSTKVVDVLELWALLRLALLLESQQGMDAVDVLQLWALLPLALLSESQQSVDSLGMQASSLALALASLLAAAMAMAMATSLVLAIATSVAPNLAPLHPLHPLEIAQLDVFLQRSHTAALKSALELAQLDLFLQRSQAAALEFAQLDLFLVRSQAAALEFVQLLKDLFLLERSHPATLLCGGSSDCHPFDCREH